MNAPGAPEGSDGSRPLLEGRGAGLNLAAGVQRDAFRLEVDVQVGPGEVLGLTGDIGSGKSTVLLLAAGRLAAASGRVLYGEQVWDEPETGTFLAQRPVSLLSQTYWQDLPEDQTGVQIVAANVERLSASPRGSDPEAVARHVLAGLGVGDHVVDRLPWTFSGAEAQRIALARAVAPRPSVVLLDEPFGALDKRTGSAVRAWLADWLASFDGSALIACSKAEHLQPISDRIHVCR